MTIFDQKGWIESDYNPFILYSDSGNILYANASAELLLSYVDKKVFYELCLSNASHEFGYKTTFINLSYEKFNFYAITVGYNDEKHIGIKLYNNPQTESNQISKVKSNKIGNIYILIDLCISLASANNEILFKKEFDPTIPEFRLSQNEFTKILRKTYESLSNSSTITTVLKLKIGEFVKIDDKKYRLLELAIKGDATIEKHDETIKEISENINIKCSYLKQGISFDIPLIV